MTSMNTAYHFSDFIHKALIKLNEKY